MRGGASFQVSSVEEAARALEYYNGFHDGFMKRMLIESHDEIHRDLSQSCTGVFEVAVDFAHYNYANGAEPFHPHNQIVRAEFRNVQDLCCDFGQGFLGNTIISVSIIPVNRRKGGEATTEQCLGLRLGRHFFLDESRRHEFRESQLFTFTDATFVEQPPAE
jgi:hypothetical protein